MVREVVSRAVVAHFRAHTAPLLVLQWDASGTLLVTASVHGHNINIFQVGHKPSLLSLLHCEGQTAFQAYISGVLSSCKSLANNPHQPLCLVSICDEPAIPSVAGVTAKACNSPHHSCSASASVSCSTKRICTPCAMQIAPGKVSSSGERLPGSAVQLLRLSRGLTPAVIQDVAFSAYGTLLAVSSARGTTHIYRLALPGQHHMCAN